MMKSKILFFICGLALIAGLLTSTGCFKIPTSPSLVASGGAGGCAGGCGDGGYSITPTPVPGGSGSTGTGSISGTISNSGGGSVSIIAFDTTNSSTHFPTSITGDGAYTITGVPDGTYEVEAYAGLTSVTYGSNVTVSGGAAVTNIDIAF